MPGLGKEPAAAIIDLLETISTVGPHAERTFT